MQGPRQKPGSLLVTFKDASGNFLPIEDAKVSVFECDDAKGTNKSQDPIATGKTDGRGRYRKGDLDPHWYWIQIWGFLGKQEQAAEVKPGCEAEVNFSEAVELTCVTYVKDDTCQEKRACSEVVTGRHVLVEVGHKVPEPYQIRYSTKKGVIKALKDQRTALLDTSGVEGEVEVQIILRKNPTMNYFLNLFVFPTTGQQITGDMSVTMRRTALAVTDDLPLWVVIRKSTELLSFNNYSKFMDYILCGGSLPTSSPTPYEEERMLMEKEPAFNNLMGRRALPFNDAEAYRVLKVATEAFLVVNCGIPLDGIEKEFDQADIDYLQSRDLGPTTTAELESRWLSQYLKAVNGAGSLTLPYLELVRRKLVDVPLVPGTAARFRQFDLDLPEGCIGILQSKLAHPCFLELIWSYWHEEGMLVQSMNALSRRFQNVHVPGDRDPLANLEIDPLRPLSNLIWGYIQDEQHRLSLVRRTYEYDHHYGLRLVGKAVPKMRPADSQSKFLEAFHNLLHLATIFFQQDDDTTVVADGFPLLNALRDVHLILSQGAHNQFGDLPSTARQEMLIQQWLLARPEFREFLPTRIMVAYPEPWMDRVDAMKKLQGWSDVNVLHYRNLGVFGEQILLSVRFGAWSATNDPAQASSWARFWRPEIQGYIHAYRAVAGVDLTLDTVDATLPAVHMQQRLATQRRQGG